MVYRLAKAKELEIRDAGLALVDGKYWDEVMQLFNKKESA
ncbi:MAG: D-ornithine 4,5-aminomutase subunit OraS [Defluviitaleaceae bacterium]|nr:D-ornithine 4,5-aminomutase subunit OraS [Defluviitaleaceae bacterium]